MKYYWRDHILVRVLLALTLLASHGLSQNAAPLSEAVILDTQEVDLGDRSIIYNRIEPPVLKPPVTLDVPRSSAGVHDSASQPSSLEEWAGQETLFLSCTVYGGQLTEVSWWHDGREIVFWSSIDFRDLAPLADLEFDGIFYSIFIGLGAATREDYEARRAAGMRSGGSSLPEWPSELAAQEAPGADSRWRTVSGGPLEAGELSAIAALHAYYDANREGLAAARTMREAARAERDAWLQAHPPQPADTRVNFFPIRSAYSEDQTGGGR